MAWIPSIREWLQKPEVHIVSGELLEVSYMEFGNVLNVWCAFASFDKAALFESFALHLIHEDGTKTEFNFAGLSESTSAQSSSGERVLWGKQTNVHVLAVAQDSAVERLAMFRDRAQSDKVRALYERIVPLLERLKNTEGPDWRNTMRKTAEFDEYRRTVQEGQIWKRGRYAVTMTAKVKQLDKPAEHHFTFELSDADIRVIRSNLEPIDKFVSSVLAQDEPPFPRPIFAFSNPPRRVKA